jgi:predicted short-subunit dehydrogenase-like oxidoreductase (DUF2520 family)
VKRISIGIVGMGRLGTALAKRLSQAGYGVSKLNSSELPRLSQLRPNVIWFCVPDANISRVAQDFAGFEWHGKFAFHSSGVLVSDVLNPLRRAGAQVASVHPLMTFVKGSVPELAGITFAIEGEAPAVKVARSIARDVRAKPVWIRKEDKVAYHAFATMICPLLVSLLAASERAASLARIAPVDSRRRMLPIIRQTLRNYDKLGAVGAFSGPIVRGDLDTVRRHLKVLTKAPAVKAVYAALAHAALKYLPSCNRRELTQLLVDSRLPNPEKTLRSAKRTNRVSKRSTPRS